MNIRIKFLPYERLKTGTVRALLKDLQDDMIVLIDAKLKPEEEAWLIRETMKRVGDEFTGIELGSIEIDNGRYNTSLNRVMSGFRNVMAERILGKKRGLTVVGPAPLVQKIKRNPHDLLVYI